MQKPCDPEIEERKGNPILRFLLLRLLDDPGVRKKVAEVVGDQIARGVHFRSLEASLHDRGLIFVHGPPASRKPSP